MKHCLWAAASTACVATVVELVGLRLAAAAALFIGTVALGLKGELDRRTPTTNEPGPDGDHDGWPDSGVQAALGAPVTWAEVTDEESVDGAAT